MESREEERKKFLEYWRREMSKSIVLKRALDDIECWVSSYTAFDQKHRNSLMNLTDQFQYMGEPYLALKKFVQLAIESHPELELDDDKLFAVGQVYYP